MTAKDDALAKLDELLDGPPGRSATHGYTYKANAGGVRVTAKQVADELTDIRALVDAIVEA